MNTVMTLVKWSIGFTFGIFAFFLFTIAMSISLVATQLLDSKIALEWIKVGTSQPKAMEELREKILVTMENSNAGSDVVDPGSQAVLEAMGNSSTPLGKDTRVVFSTHVIGKNITVNAEAFYKWLDGVGEEAHFTVFFDGTVAQKESFLANFLRTRYEALPHCTAEQAADVAQDEETSLFTVPCQVEPIAQSVYQEQAHVFLSDPEVLKYVDGGISFTQNLSSKRRVEIKSIGRFAAIATTLCWGFTIGLLVLMVLLMNPLPAGMVVAGGTAGVTGIIFMGIWKAVFTNTGIVTGTTVFYVQGTILMIIGLGLIGGGIFMLLRKKSNTFPIDGEMKPRVDA